MAEVVYSATGRRKSSVARVRLVPGEGKVIINGREMNDYFGLETLKLIVNQPLELTETKDKYDILVNVIGGGISGQAGAIRHGISRALCKVDEEFRPALKKAGLMTRDPREKERRKYGLKKARKASQYSKTFSLKKQKTFTENPLQRYLVAGDLFVFCFDIDKECGIIITVLLWYSF